MEKYENLQLKYLKSSGSILKIDSPKKFDRHTFKRDEGFEGLI